MDIHNRWFCHADRFGCMRSLFTSGAVTSNSRRASEGVGCTRDPGAGTRSKVTDQSASKKKSGGYFPTLLRRPRIIHFVRSSFPQPASFLYPFTRSIMSDPANRAKAWPLAEAALNNQVPFFFLSGGFIPSIHLHPSRAFQRPPSNKILELVNQATQYKQLKKGANEGAHNLIFVPSRLLSFALSSSHENLKPRYR